MVENFFKKPIDKYIRPCYNHLRAKPRTKIHKISGKEENTMTINANRNFINIHVLASEDVKA